MQMQGKQTPASPLAQSGSVPLASDRRHADASAGAGTSEQHADTVCHNLEGLVVQRHDAYGVLIIGGRWVRPTPTQYAMLVPLLEQFGRPVSHAELYRRAFGRSYSPRDVRRVYHHIDTLQPRLSPFGLMIRTVIDFGYMLLREAREH